MLTRLCQNVALAIISTAIFLAVGEGLARLCYTPKAADSTGLFEYDHDKIYALRKNIANGYFVGKKVTTNSLGHRDREIQMNKPNNGFRILAIGDSVTFGHGVLAEEAWPEALELRLAARFPNLAVDVINTAVPGNSPFQEYYDLKRALVLQPDAVILQFVLNDLVEPYRVFRRFGGKGKDYHKVDDIPWWNHELSQRSALFLLLKDVVNRASLGALTVEQMRAKALQREAELSWDAGADPPKDPQMHEAWRECLAWMQKEIDLCRKSGIPVILMVTPVELQFRDGTRTYAQQRLAEFAQKNGITFLDLLPLLRERAARDIALSIGADAELPVSVVAARYPKEWAESWKRYFLDYDHFTPKGHNFTAEILFALTEKIGARQ